MNRKFASPGLAAGLGLGLSALGCGAASAQVSSGPIPYGVYLGASAGETMYHEDGLPGMNPTIGVLRAGQQFNPYLGIEGRIGTTVNGGSTYAYGHEFHVDAQVLYGAYAKAILPINPWISAYAIGGLGGVQWHRNYPTFNSNDIGLSFGVGAEFNLGSNASLDLEWARLTDGTNHADGYNYGYNANMLTFGVNWRFL